MKRITSSTWISFTLIALIPISWVVQFILNKMMLADLVSKFGDEVLTNMDEVKVLFLTIPISQLVTLATFVIPVVFARKAAREVSTNLTLPVGRNAQATSEKTDEENKTVSTPPAG